MAAELYTPLDIEGSSNDPVTEQATQLDVTDVDIHLTGAGTGSCIAKYEYGTLSGSSFVALPLVEADRIGSVTIDGDEFYAMANTAISPSEKYLSLYDIIRRRISAHMAGLNILKG